MKNKRTTTGWRLLLLSGMLACGAIHAQTNLIPYGNFEAYTALAIEANSSLNPCYNNEFPSGWMSPTNATPDMISDGSTPCDYFHNNAGCGFYPQVCESDNKMGCQTNMSTASHFPSASHVYMGIYTAGESATFPNDPFREYVRTTINKSGGLTAGQCYHLTYYVSRADLTKFATPVQALITDQDLTNTGGFGGVLDPSDGIWCRSTVVYNKLAWTKIDFDFVAEGGETYLYLGFFEDNSGPIVYDMAATEGCTSSSGISNSTYLSDGSITAYYYIDNISLIETAGPTFTPDYAFNNSNPNISGTFTNKNIIISGNVTISANTIFDNCTVKCNDASTITVPSGKTFSILNTTTLEAGCANMWEGIIVNNGTLIMRGSTISDAHTAITFTGSSATWQLYRDASSNLNFFTRNTVDILFNGTLGAGSILKATVFDHTSPLHDATQGIGGYGTTNLIFDGPGSSTADLIGGTTATDGCLFTGGQNGIVSSKYSLAIQNCVFTGQANVAIEFSDVPPQSPLRTLTVTESSFYSAREHIVAHSHVDLTVKACSLSNAQQNSIEWFDNHDNYLQIGDTSNVALGNVFTNNAWYAVCAMHNSTLQTDMDLLRQNIAYTNGPTAHYTRIIIAENTVNCNSSASGILIAEWQLGQNTSYGHMNIKHNTFNDAFNGVQLLNVRGWGGVWSTVPANLPQQDVKYNLTYTSSQYASNPSAIKAINAHGFAFRENGVSSDNPYNYANQGLYFLNSSYSEVYGNIVQAGTGFNVNADMYGSNLHCNWLGAYSTGFYFGSAWLRGGITQTHGIPTVEEYNNLVPYTMYPWNADVHLDNSNVDNNKWIWGGAATNLDVLRTGNTGSGSLFSSLTAPDLCENGFPGIMAADTNIYMTFTDTVLQWIADYNYEVRHRTTGSGGGVSISSSITDLIDIEELVATGEYSDALTDLAAYTPTCPVEENYKEVLTILATLADENREATTGEKGDLIAIAEQQFLAGGPAVAIARGYLEAKYYLHFNDARSMENLEIKGTAMLSAPCSTEPESSTWLSFIDEDGVDVGIEGCYIAADGSFIFDPLEIAYHQASDPYLQYRISSKYGSKYNVVTMDFHTLEDWIIASPLVIDLAGVQLELDTLTETAFTSIDTYTSMDGDDDVTYSVGSISVDGGTDMLITKEDKEGVLWTRIWSAPVSGGTNAATCMYLDEDENVYVAGKIYNGANYDVQILKYDTDGNLIWTCLFPDAHTMDDIPVAIYANTSLGTVEIVSTCGFNSRYIRVHECLPGVDRRALIADDAATAGIIPPAFYPNPNNGQLFIDLKGNMGGTFELVNTAGQVVYTEVITGNREVVLPATIENGVYLIKFTGEGEPYYQKLMIHRN